MRRWKWTFLHRNFYHRLLIIVLRNSLIQLQIYMQYVICFSWAFCLVTDVKFGLSASSIDLRRYPSKFFSGLLYRKQTKLQELNQKNNFKTKIKKTTHGHTRQAWNIERNIEDREDQFTLARSLTRIIVHSQAYATK